MFEKKDICHQKKLYSIEREKVLPVGDVMMMVLLVVRKINSRIKY